MVVRCVSMLSKSATRVRRRARRPSESSATLASKTSVQPTVLSLKASLKHRISSKQPFYRRPYASSTRASGLGLPDSCSRSAGDVMDARVELA